MAHRKHTSRQAGTDRAEPSAKETTKESSDIGPPSRLNTKDDPPNDADKVTASERPKKRRKTNSNTGLGYQDPSPSDDPEITMIKDMEYSELASSPFAQELPIEVRHLSSKYDFTMMSILSSAKISDKVKNLLHRVGNFSFAEPKSKPGIVVLHAKSEVASKMVSIVEIARQDIEHNKGKWWQYSKLGEQIAELMVKSVKSRNDGRKLSERQKEQAGRRAQVIKEAGCETKCASDEVQCDDAVVDGDEEMEDAFESMVNAKDASHGAKQSGKVNGKKIRATPVMTIYFARVPVPGLKELYGYVIIDLFYAIF